MVTAPSCGTLAAMDIGQTEPRGFQAMADEIPAELPITKRMAQTWADSGSPDDQVDLVEMISGIIIALTALESEIVHLKRLGATGE